MEEATLQELKAVLAGMGICTARAMERTQQL
jgi:hypothetical protein